jgi:amino acid adenylation domain-containing protein
MLGRVKSTALGAYAHQELPFERLVAQLRPERDLSRQPLFQVMLSVESVVGEPQLSLAGLEVRRLQGSWTSSKLDLTLVVAQTPTGLRGHVEYATDLFERQTIERLIGHLNRLLESIVERPDGRIGELDLLTLPERQLIEGWSRASADPLRPRCLHEIIAEQAAKSPGARAVTCGTESLTFAELETRANQLAHHLRSLGVGPDRLVALCMSRSLEMIVGILGILKAGGAYLPIDPTYPAERIAYLLEDSGSSVLLTDGTLSSLPAGAVTTVWTTRDQARIQSWPTEAPLVHVRPQHLMYCIYTSGSTGKPKGTLVTHANVARLLTSTQHLFEFGPQDVWTLFHSFAFDFSVWEIFGALAYGGRLVIVPFMTSRSPEAYFELLSLEGVTVLNQTPSAFSLLSRVAEERGELHRLDRLRYVVFGGEALSTGALEPWAQVYGVSRPKLVNMYGITETTVHVTFREIGVSDIRMHTVSPIGGPIPDLQLHVLDERMNSVPIGVAGELFVGGPGLARGYHRRPALTAQRFVPHPSPGVPGESLYRTGDLVRRRSDGQLDYLGRIDQQIKLHGFRIELGEIEAALCGCTGVRSAVAAVLPGSGGQQRLIAWVSGEHRDRIDTEGVRAALAERLPAFMIPSDIVVLDRLPLTSHGKVDRAALLRGYEPARRTSHDYCAPRTAMESELVRLWEEVLQTRPIGVRDNFFAVGGDSIRAIQAVRGARERGIALSVALLFKHQSIGELASAVFGTHAEQSPAGARALENWTLGDEVLAAARSLGAQGVYPVTSMQQIMLEQYALRHHSGEGVYHVQQSFRLRGHEPSIEAMRAALGSLTEEHAVLRTVFLRGRDGTFAQAILPTARPVVLEHFLVGRSVAEQERYIDHTIEVDRAEGFQVSDTSAPPLRFDWFRTEASGCEFFMSIHHAIDDGWGNQHFLSQLFDRYRRIRNGESPVVSAQPNVFREFVALERDMAGSLEAESFWRSEGIVAAGVADLIERQPQRAEAVRYGTTTTESFLRDLHSACRSARVSLKAAVLAALSRAMRRHFRVDVATVGVVCNGRSDRLSDPLRALGLFWNLAPISLGEPEGGSLLEWEVQRRLTRMEPFTMYPLAKIARLYGVEELFFATLTFTNFHNRFNGEVGDGVRVEAARTLDRFHYPLNFHVAVHGRADVLGITVEFDTRYFSQESVRELTSLLLEELQVRVAVVMQDEAQVDGAVGSR